MKGTETCPFYCCSFGLVGLELELSAGLTVTIGLAGADGAASDAPLTCELSVGAPGIGWNGCFVTAGAVGFAVWLIGASGADETAGAGGFTT